MITLPGLCFWTAILSPPLSLHGNTIYPISHASQLANTHVNFCLDPLPGNIVRCFICKPSPIVAASSFTPGTSRSTLRGAFFSGLAKDTSRGNALF